jgi:hypothetical protein
VRHFGTDAGGIDAVFLWPRFGPGICALAGSRYHVRETRTQE